MSALLRVGALCETMVTDFNLDKLKTCLKILVPFPFKRILSYYNKRIMPQLHTITIDLDVAGHMY